MHFVEMAFGHYRSNGEPLSPHLIALAEKKGLTVFCQCFLGGQIYHPIGGYLLANGSVMIEPSTIIRAYTSETERYAMILQALIRELREMLEQASVLLVIARLDGMMYWGNNEEMNSLFSQTETAPLELGSIFSIAAEPAQPPSIIVPIVPNL